MSISLVTGYAGSGHVTSANAGNFNAGICGLKKYVLETGEKFSYSIESNNLITIASGDLVNQGRHISILKNTTENAVIENGTQSKWRIDVIAIRYSKNSETGVESAELIVHKGTEADSTSGIGASVPKITTGDIFNGDFIDDFPLYYVTICDLKITTVEAVFTVLPTLSGMIDKIYPVGSLYLTMSEEDPADLFGGLWEKVTDSFLIGAGNTYKLGDTGGSERMTLSTANMPAHTHTVSSHTHSIPAHTHTASTASAGGHTHTYTRNKVAESGTSRYAPQGGTDAETNSTHTAGAHTHTVTVDSCSAFTTGGSGDLTTDSKGLGSSFEIMPPYLAVYIWKRTA